MGLPARDSELIQIMDQSLAEAARRAGAWLACRSGCTQCCHGAFAIDALDAARLRLGMDELRATDPHRAGAIEERARQWLEAFAPGFPGDPISGVLGSSAEEEERFEHFANDAACPALDPATGRCDLYAWRPMTCRVFGPPVRVEGGALACCELCFVGAEAEVIASCEMPVPHALEEAILDQLGDETQTVVAFALIPRSSHPGR